MFADCRELGVRNIFNPNEWIDSKVMTIAVLARCTFGEKHIIPPYVTLISPKSTLQADW
jgi:hypothetical protein